MKRILSSILFAAAAIFVPKLALAAPCSPSHTFVTGEVLTAGVLNSNPVTFSGCFNNLDNTNVGSAGIYASQIKPTNSSQATFGNSISYVFQGGLTSLNTVLATSGASTAFASTANDGVPALLFNSNSASNQTSIGDNAGAGYPYFSIAQLNSSGTFQKWLVGVDSSDNFNVPNGGVITNAVSTLAGTTDSTLTASQCTGTNGSKRLTSSGEACPVSFGGGTRLGGQHVETVNGTSVGATTTGSFTFGAAYNSTPNCVVTTIGSVAPAFSVSAVTTTTLTVYNSASGSRTYEAICSGW